MTKGNLDRWSSEPIFCITMDTDWVPDEILKYALDILDQYGISATLFMTNKYQVDLQSHELAIHPNFTTLNFEDHIQKSLQDVPNAMGTRSHSLFYTERLRTIYQKYELKYDSNYMMYLQSNIRPFWLGSTTVELPMYWMDYFHLDMSKKSGTSKATLQWNLDQLQQPGLKIITFHPMHLFLNTKHLEHYETAKVHYQEPEILSKNHRNTTSEGICTMFVALLEWIKQHQVPTYTLSEITQEFLKQQPHELTRNHQ